MSTHKGAATALTDAGEAPVGLNLRSGTPDGNHTIWRGTMTIASVDVWKAIANAGRLRIRTPDGREGSFNAPEGAGGPPSGNTPAAVYIESTDDAPF
jgi:hypothetical protein